MSGPLERERQTDREREITNKESDHVRLFTGLWSQELHGFFPVIVGKVLCEYGLHFIH